MNVFAWILLVFLLIELAVGPYNVGKPRGPKTASDAVINSLAWLLYIGLFLGAVLL